METVISIVITILMGLVAFILFILANSDRL